MLNNNQSYNLCKKIPLPVSEKTEMPADINYDMKFG